MITVLHEQRRTDWPDDAAQGDSLWLDRQAIEQATGWIWKAEGLCQGDDVCVPLARAADMIRDGRLDPRTCGFGLVERDGQHGEAAIRR